jgi:2-polyprenyl-3-methyl-5-hydroxy-6-metoxy-1,4-benzoquinol methylase
MKLVRLKPCSSYGRPLRSQIGRDGSVLDVGCGIRPVFARWLKRGPKEYLGIDAYPPYIEYCKRHWPKYSFKLHVAPPLPLEDDAFDIVILDDVIEHLEKDDGWELFREAKRVARRGVVVGSPVGFEEQTEDAWGLDGHVWQTHRSGWKPRELKPSHAWILPSDTHRPGWFVAWCPT